MALSTILFLLASSYVTLAALIEECPPEESIPFCRCFKEDYGLYFSCSSGVSVTELKNSLQALKGYKINRLFLGELNATALPDDLFQGLHVKRLNLWRVEVDGGYLGDVPFSGLEDSLEDLQFEYSFDATGPLRNLKLGHLHRLKEVRLVSIPVTEIGNDWFKDLKSLESFRMSKSGLERLGDKAFASLTNLRTLSLYNDSLKEISRSMLPSSVNHLEYLLLMYNKISVLPSDLFTEMPSLTRVHLQGNFIHSLKEDTWSPILNQLRVLNFRENPLRCDEDLKWVCNRNTRPIWSQCTSPVEKKGLSVADFCKMNV